MSQGDGELLDRRFVPKGRVIIEEGDTGTKAFLVQSGKVAVFRTSEGKRIDIGTLGPGQIFGETALIIDTPRTASVVAAEDTNIIAISREALQAKLKKSDPTIRAIVPMLLRRLKNTGDALSGKQTSLEDFDSCVSSMYEAVETGLGPHERAEFSTLVKPALDEFLSAVTQFKILHGK